jgi:tape measure domain-containing protein
MTVINSYSVSLGLNANDYIKNSSLARGETAKLKQMINTAKTPLERYAQTYDLLEKALQKQSISLGTYKRLLDEARAKVEQFNTKIREATRTVETKTTKVGAMVGAFSRLQAQLGPINSLLATYLGLSTAKKAFSLATEAEDASIAFEVLTGSVDDSLVLMRELRAFSDKSPITFGGAQTAARTMLSFNVAVQDVIPTVKMLSDVVGGNNDRFKMLSLGYSQMSAAGRLMGQDLLQMINAGFNPLQTISKITGETLIELKKRMEDGGVSSAEVANAFRVATQEGGRFHGMTERLAQTMSGKLNIAMSDLQKAGIRLGQTIGPLGTDLAKGLADAAQAASPVIWVIQKMTDGIRAMFAFMKDGLAIANYIATKMGGGQPAMIDGMANMKALLDEIGNRKALADAQKAQESSAKMSERAQERKVDAVAKEAEKVKEVTKAVEDKVKAERKSYELEQRAYQNAVQHFQLERKKQMERQKQLRSTAISSLEVGSEGAASFMQNRRNQTRFGRQEMMKGQASDPTQWELLVEARKQLGELKIANAKQERMVAAMNRVAEQVAQNGFQRIR